MNIRDESKMPPESETLFASKQCPSCRKQAIQPIAFAFGSKRPTFSCASCGAQLTTVAKPRMVLGIGFAFLMFPLSRSVIEEIGLIIDADSITYRLVEIFLIAPLCVMAVWLVNRGLFLRVWKAKA